MQTTKRATQTTAHRARYASVVLDVDSTVSDIEGIEWLSLRCDPAVQARIRETTELAMRGDIPLESVYGERLQLVAPTRDDIESLAEAYITHITPGVREAVATLRNADVRVVLVSGGLREAIVPLGTELDIPESDVHAVPIIFNEHGIYSGYDTDAPLARRGGKPAVVRQLGLERPLFAMGDGITDAELKSVVDTFAAYVGCVRHERVVEAADVLVTSFTELPSLILTTG